MIIFQTLKAVFYFTKCATKTTKGEMYFSEEKLLQFSLVLGEQVAYQTLSHLLLPSLP